MLLIKWGEEVQIVKGINRSCIYDLPRAQYYFIPNELIDLINDLEGQSVEKLSFLNEDEKKWISFLFEKEFIITIPPKFLKNFPKLNLNWIHPSYIINAIVSDNKFLEKSLLFLDQVICKQITIECATVSKLYKIMHNYFQHTNFQNVDVILNKIDDKLIKKIKREFPIIGKIYSSNRRDNKQNDKHVFFYDKQKINNQPLFVINIEFFSESQKQHPYFNRKMFIGSNGEIKNAPECEESYGNIHQIKNHSELLKIIENEGFQKYWSVHKEVCDVCKDCELRYMCLDNRLPYQRNKKEWYHKTECNYNPYICKWQGEEGYKTLRECSVISNEKSFSIDHEKIAKINQELWEETE